MSDIPVGYDTSMTAGPMLEAARIAASFRDPAGFLFPFDGRIFRFIKNAGLADYEVFAASQAADKFIKSGQLVYTRALTHEEIGDLREEPRLRMLLSQSGAGTIVEHERVDFPSFPNEWCAEMLHAAGRLTIQIALEFLREGVGLKDGTPYNVLFRGPNPVFIDVLSFERRDPHDPIWLPYAQFTRMFLLPLLAYKYYGVQLGEVFTTRRDGLEHDEVYRWSRPLQRVRPLFLSLVSMPTWLASKRNPDDQKLYEAKKLKNPEQATFVLESTLHGLRKKLDKLAPPVGLSSTWSDYTVSNNNYSSDQAGVKETFVHETLKEIRPGRVLDIGCNTGQFSAIAAKLGSSVVAIDYDPVVIGSVWRKSQAENLNILPLVVNLSRPTPATGWRNDECRSFIDRARGHFDALLMLAVIHHMMVTDRIPLPEIIDLAAELTRDLVIIEFIAPADSMFRRITRGRDHLHADLTEEVFENAALKRFNIVRKHHIENSSRTLYCLRRK
jgi:SAM-dependent methyltransferase